MIPALQSQCLHSHAVWVALTALFPRVRLRNATVNSNMTIWKVLDSFFGVLCTVADLAPLQIKCLSKVWLGKGKDQFLSGEMFLSGVGQPRPNWCTKG